MRTGLIAALVGGLALAGCAAYPYGYGTYGYGYGYGPYGYGYSPGYYAAPAYVGFGGGSYYYGRPYAYNRPYYNNNWHDGGWHGGNWNGGGWHGGGNVYSRSSQPAQRAATPQTRSFEHALGFVPNP